MNKKFRSVAVTVTPFSDSNIPNFNEIAIQTQNIGKSNIDAIFPCASTGEYVKITPENKCLILKTVSESNSGKKALVAGACAASVEEAELYIDVAKQYDYDACVICPPYYFPQSQDDIFKFYKEVSEYAESMPIIAYHVPFFTTGIELSTYRRILEIDGIKGIKDSSANMKRIAHCCNIASKERNDFYVYTGTDDCLLPALCAGCHGSMTALAATLPDEISGIYNAFDSGKIAEAMKIQSSILPIIRDADSLTFPMGYKLLAKAIGTEIGQITEEQQIIYNKIVEKLKKEIKR